MGIKLIFESKLYIVEKDQSTLPDNGGRKLKKSCYELGLEIPNIPKNYKKNDGSLDVIDIVSQSMIRSFEINKIETLDDLGSDHLPMISTIKFNNNEISSHNIIKLYHKLDKNHAASLLTELNQKDCNNKEEIDELFNDITEKLKNIHKNIPTKRIKSNNVSLPESTRIKIKRKLINYWRKNKTKIIKTKINKLNKEIKKKN